MPSIGKRQRANSAVGRSRRPNLDAHYNRRIRSIEPGAFTFRILLIRPEKPRRDRFMTLDRATTDLDWGDDESGSVLSGSITLRRPSPLRVNSIPLLRGHRIRLQLLWGGRWRRMWDMRVADGVEIDHGSGTITAQLEDDLTALSLNQREWEFKKDKAHPKGWTADQITRKVCRDQRVRPGSMPRGRKRIKKLKVKGSGLAVIRKAWAIEKKETLRRYTIRFRNTRLHVVPFGRPGTLFVVKGVEKSATSTSEPTKGNGKRPVTSIKAKGRIKSQGKSRKVEETVRSHKAMARFGFSEVERDYGRVDSRSELRREAKRDLSEAIKVTRTATLTLPGIPFLEKGSTLKWVTKEAGWHGRVGNTAQDRAFAFVTSARHSLSSSAYDTEVHLSQEDPYYSDRKRRDEERRDKKKKERGGRDRQKAAA